MGRVILKMLVGLVALSACFGCEFASDLEAELSDPNAEVAEREDQAIVDDYVEAEVPERLWGRNPPVWTVQDEQLQGLFEVAWFAATGQKLIPMVTAERTNHYVKWSDPGFCKKWLGYWNRYEDGTEQIRICPKLKQQDDLLGIMSHEILHSLGVGHSPRDTDSLMHQSRCAKCEGLPELPTEYDLETLARRTIYNLTDLPPADPSDYEFRD